MPWRIQDKTLLLDGPLFREAYTYSCHQDLIFKLRLTANAPAGPVCLRFYFNLQKWCLENLSSEYILLGMVGA